MQGLCGSATEKSECANRNLTRHQVETSAFRFQDYLYLLYHIIYSFAKSSFSIVLRMVIFTFFINVPNCWHKSTEIRAEMSNFALNYNKV